MEEPLRKESDDMGQVSFYSNLPSDPATRLTGQTLSTQSGSVNSLFNFKLALTGERHLLQETVVNATFL